MTHPPKQHGFWIQALEIHITDITYPDVNFVVSKKSKKVLPWLPDYKMQNGKRYSMSGFLHQLTSSIVWSPPDSARDRPILGLVIGRRTNLMIDAGASPNHIKQFLTSLNENNISLPRLAVVTHWHWDHVLGIGTLNVPTVGHEGTYVNVKRMAKLDWRDEAIDARVSVGEEIPFVADHIKVELTNTERSFLEIVAPDIIYQEEMEIDLGGKIARITHVGGDHSADSSIIYIPEEKVAFLGDCFCSGFIQNDTFFTVSRLFPLLDRLEALPAEYYVMSHYFEPVPRSEFIQDVQLLRRIGTLVDRIGNDREKIISCLNNETPDEDTMNYVRSFIRGLQPDAVLNT